MSGAKTAVLNNLKKVPDTITDEMEVISRLYALARFEHNYQKTGKSDFDIVSFIALSEGRFDEAQTVVECDI